MADGKTKPKRKARAKKAAPTRARAARASKQKAAAAGRAPSPTAAARPTSRVPVTTVVLTLNEEVNLPGCLASLDWCDDIIIVDSFSTDRTEEIARSFGARFYQNRFQGFGVQRNFALDQCDPKHPWILVLDADERVTPELAAEMGEKLARVPEDVSAFRVKRRFHMWGRWLKHSSLYPTWLVRLFRRDRVRWSNRGHAEAPTIEGRTEELEHDLIDENLKGMVEWFERQARYARNEAAYELAHGGTPPTLKELLTPDPFEARAAWKRLASNTPARPILYFAWSYLVRGGFRDGMDGLTFCAMRAAYQQMIVASKYDLRRHGK